MLTILMAAAIAVTPQNQKQLDRADSYVRTYLAFAHVPEPVRVVADPTLKFEAQVQWNLTDGCWEIRFNEKGLKRDDYRLEYLAAHEVYHMVFDGSILRTPMKNNLNSLIAFSLWSDEAEKRAEKGARQWMKDRRSR